MRGRVKSLGWLMSRPIATGNRQQATGIRHQATGNGKTVFVFRGVVGGRSTVFLWPTKTTPRPTFQLLFGPKPGHLVLAIFNDMKFHSTHPSNRRAGLVLRFHCYDTNCACMLCASDTLTPSCSLQHTSCGYYTSNKTHSTTHARCI